MNKLFTQQSDHPLFRYFTEEERDAIEALGRELRLDEGGYLIRKDEVDSALFAVEEGVLEVVTIRDGAPAVVATIGAGDVLGEVSFIDDSPRTISVKAAEPSTVRVWEKETLTKALAAKPELLSKFSVAMNELLVERLRDTVRRQGAFRPA